MAKTNMVTWQYMWKKIKTNHTLLCIILEMRNEIGNNQVKVAVIYVFNHRIMESKKDTSTLLGFYLVVNIGVSINFFQIRLNQDRWQFFKVSPCFNMQICTSFEYNAGIIDICMHMYMNGEWSLRNIEHERFFLPYLSRNYGYILTFGQVSSFYDGTRKLHLTVITR